MELRFAANWKDQLTMLIQLKQEFWKLIKHRNIPLLFLRELANLQVISMLRKFNFGKASLQLPGPSRLLSNLLHLKRPISTATLTAPFQPTNKFVFNSLVTWWPTHESETSLKRNYPLKECHWQVNHAQAPGTIIGIIHLKKMSMGFRLQHGKMSHAPSKSPRNNSTGINQHFYLEKQDIIYSF